MLRGTVVLVVALTAGADRSVIAQTRPAAPAGSSDLAAGRKVRELLVVTGYDSGRYAVEYV